jgi:N utilization substance protein B
MSTRRDAREWVVQVLYELDMNPRDVGEALADFWVDKTPDKRARAFTEKQVSGLLEQREEIDSILGEAAEHWDVRRMSVIDRNVMRMAIYELKYCPDIPAAVTINEAVDLAKYFNCTESGRFVNGILDRVRKDLERGETKPD